MSVEKVRPVDRYLEIFYSLAAVPVLLGALFKLTNSAPLGNPNLWLQIGLYTEALVFLSYALLFVFAPPKKVDELGNAVNGDTQAGVAIKGSPLQSMDEMLRAADITPESLDKLSNGFKSLEANINRISSASSAVVDTASYVKQINEATATMAQVNQYYHQLAAASGALADSAGHAKNAQEQVAALADNLAKLNKMYSGMIAAMQVK